MKNENEFEYVLKLALDKNNLEALIHLIIDNAELSYNGKELKIGNESTVLQFIKYLKTGAYERKLEELKKENI